MKCPKCGTEMHNCCAEAMKNLSQPHSCGQSEDICPNCHYRQVAENIFGPADADIIVFPFFDYTPPRDPK